MADKKSKAFIVDIPAAVALSLLVAGWFVAAFLGRGLFSGKGPLAVLSIWNTTGTQNLIYVMLFIVAYRTYIDGRTHARDIADLQERAASAESAAAQASIRQVKLDAVRDLMARFFAEPFQRQLVVVQKNQENLRSNALYSNLQRHLSKDERQRVVDAVISVNNFFVMMGALLRLEILNPEDVLPVFGPSCITFYNILGPLNQELGLDEKESGVSDFQGAYRLATEQGYKDGLVAYKDALAGVVES